MNCSSSGRQNCPFRGVDRTGELLVPKKGDRPMGQKARIPGYQQSWRRRRSSLSTTITERSILIPSIARRNRVMSVQVLEQKPAALGSCHGLRC